MTPILEDWPFLCQAGLHKIYRHKNGRDLALSCKSDKDTGNVAINKEQFAKYKTNTFADQGVIPGGTRYVWLGNKNSNAFVSLTLEELAPQLVWSEKSFTLVDPKQLGEEEHDLLWLQKPKKDDFIADDTAPTPMPDWGEVRIVLEPWLSRDSVDIHVGTLVGKLPEGTEIHISNKGVRRIETSW